jgi:histidinol-phosphate aminotransferase
MKEKPICRKLLKRSTRTQEWFISAIPTIPPELLLNVAAKRSCRQPRKKTFVFIDEAYTEYAELPSLASLAVTDPNIVVAKTFSKVYGLAGARVGYAIAHPDTIRSLSKCQAWPDAGVSMVSCNAAMASLDDKEFVSQCMTKAKAARETCYDCFQKLSLEYIPSSTNFILFNIDKIKGDFTNLMQAKNIYVQFREHFGGKWCRVSHGYY